jgi:LemA protein
MGERDGNGPARAGGGGYQVLLGAGIVLLLFGLMATAGSLMSKRLSGDALDNPFDFLFVPLILYLVPAVMIAIALAKLESKIRVTVAEIIAITLFGMAVSLTGDVMKTYNYYVRADEAITQALNDVEIIYQKRFNLIKNLDVSSKKYVEHERAVIRDIASARQAMAGAASDDEKLSAMRNFDAATRNLVVNIEQYPNLKADQLILELMKGISATESELVAQKREFNKQATDYNRSIRLMPYAITARMFGFAPRRYFDKESGADIYDATKLLAPAK